MFLEYIDLPPVPAYLIKTYEEITSINPKFKIMEQYPHYETRIVEYNLRNFLNRTFIDNGLLTDLVAQYHFVHDQISTHKDIGRTVAYNFLLYPGGDSVITNFYNDDKELLESYRIEPFRWHRLSVGTFHNVENIDNKLRVAITVNEKPHSN